MKKIHIIISMLLFTTAATAQMKIKDGTITGTSTSPNANAILELESSNKGLLMPRVALTSTTSFAPLAAHVAGMTVYNIATINDVTPGYYYDNGTKWVAVGSTVATNAWNLTGNAITTGNFMGTTTDQDVVFKRFNVQSGLLNNSLANTSWGVGSLNPATTGQRNVANGYKVLFSNTTGSANIASGYLTLYSNTTGNDNVASGDEALYNNISGSNNVANGLTAMFWNTTGHENAATGEQALFNNTTGASNAGDGQWALTSNTTGSWNTASGQASLLHNTTGNYNTGIGEGSGVNSQTGNLNTFLGYNTGVTTDGFSNAVAIGANATIGQSNSMILGGTGTSAINVGVGTSTPNYSALLDLTSTNQGFLAPRVALVSTTTWGLAPAGSTPVAGMILYNTATINDVTPGVYYNDGTKWVAVSGAGAANAWNLTGNAGTTPGTNFMGTTDDKDVVFKRNNIQSGLLNSNQGNTSWGVNALSPATTGFSNTAIGGYSLTANTTGNQNTSVGFNSMQDNLTGTYNVAVGVAALQSNLSGQENTALGQQALQFNSGSFNIGIGDGAGSGNMTGSSNIFIGVDAGTSTDGLTNCAAIGNNTIVNASNTMQFANGSTTGIGFAGGVPSSGKMIVVGVNSSTGNGAYLTSGGAWTNGSDRNIKDNITDLDGKDVLSKIKDLEVPRWRYKGTDEFHIGPIAQDFYAAFNVGLDDKHISTIDPAGVALIGVKELAIENDSLKSQINDLQQQLNDLKNTVTQLQRGNNNQGGSTLVGMNGAKLEQNAPNPYSTTTTIGYFIPESTTNAQLVITDVNGQVLKDVALNDKGNGQVILNAGTLTSGNYFYTLVVDGQKIDTKEMVLTR